MKDRESKLKLKQYLDKKYRAKVMPIGLGDTIVVKQEKYTLRPPWYINLYDV